jgi:hypothetical protein
VIASLRDKLRDKLNDPRCQKIFCIVLLLLQPVLFYWRTVIGLRSHIPYDIGEYHLPQIQFLAQCIRQGVPPLWDPYAYAGMPMHADMQAQLFYPPTWIVMFLGTLSGRYFFYFLEWMNPVHMMFAGVCTFPLLRRMGLRTPTALLGASVFQLGGFYASQAQHLCAICSAAWLPVGARAVYELRQGFNRRWVEVRWVEVRWVAILAVATAMSLLAGFAAAAIVVAVAVILFALALIGLREATWRIAGPLAAGFVWGALMAAVILIPVWTLTNLSIASWRSLWYTTGGGLPLEALVSLVRPNYYHIFDLEHFTGPVNFTFLYTYSGIVPIALLAIAPFMPRAKGAWFLGVTVIVTLWMLGEHTPVYGSLFPHFPKLLRGALYAEYALIAFSFFVGITAAMELDRFAARLPQLLLWALVLFTSWDLIHTGSKRPMNTYNGGPRLGDYNRDDLSGTALVATTFHDLSAQTLPPARFDYLDNAFSVGSHAAGFLRIPTTDGDNPFMLQRIHRLRALYASGPIWERLLTVDHPASHLLDMQSVDYLTGYRIPPPEALTKAGLEFVNEVHAMKIYRNPRALPRFFLTPRVRKSSGEDETFRLLANPAFDPAAEAIVEGIPSDRDGLAVAPVQVDTWTENRIDLTVANSAPAFLATSETLYPGWRASVNGVPQPLLMTNGAFRGLWLKPGRNRIVMQYRPWSQLVALLISLAAAIPALLFVTRPVFVRTAR